MKRNRKKLAAWIAGSFVLYGGIWGEPGIAEAGTPDTVADGTTINTDYWTNGYHNLAVVYYSEESSTENIEGKSLTFADGGAAGWIWTGYTEGSGTVSGNTLTITGGTLHYGAEVGYSKTGKVENNTLTISGDASIYAALGGETQTGSVSGNEVTMTGGTVTGSLRGGDSSSGTVSGNSVTILAGSVDSAYGGSTTDGGTVTKNTLKIEGGTIGCAAGGESDVNFGTSGTATDNTLEITGGIITGTATGGWAGSYSATGTAVRNRVKLSKGTVQGNLYGGRIYDAGTAEANTVDLISGTVGGNVYGGYSNGNNGSALNNTVNLYGTTVAGTIYGGYAGTVSGNTLNIYGTGLTAGNIANFTNVNFYLPSTVTNGSAVLTLNGGTATKLAETVVQVTLKSSAFLAAGDTITLLYNANGISGGTLVVTNAAVNCSDVAYDGNLSLAATSTAIIGTVTSMSKAKTAPTTGDTAVNLLAADSNVTRAVDGSAYGAYSADGTASAGTIVYNGGSNAIGQNLYGAYSYGAGAAASGSQVTLESGTISGNLVGGAAISSDDTSASATGNTVTLESGTVSGDVYGGYASHIATGNTVNLDGASVTGDVYGGYALHSITTGNTVNWTSGDVAGIIYGGNETDYTDNILNIYGSSLTAGNLANFSTINYYLPSSTANGSTIVTLNGGGTTDLTGTTVNVDASGTSSLEAGDTVTLLSTNGTLNTSATTLSGTLTKGVSMDYDLALAADSSTLKLKVEGGKLKAQTKSLTETRAGQASLLNSGADFLTSTAMEQASAAAAGAVGTQRAGGDGIRAAGLTPFYAVGGSALRANTGSYVDMKGLNMTLGLAREVKNAPGKLLYGPMFEYGAGSYTSHLDDGTRGDGNSHYYGAGVFAKEQRNDGFYYEGSLRAGRTTADYRSYDLSGATGTSDGHVSYDTSNSYWGAHLGAGHVTKLTNGDSVDLYGKYFYGHTSGTDADLSSGETYHFDAVNSHRLRLGGRYTHAMNAVSSVYAGAAYQYEFDGDARASCNGYDTATPSIKGGSGMLELGWLVKPSKTSPVTVDLGLTGWAGKQQGLSVQAGAQWAF